MLACQGRVLNPEASHDFFVAKLQGEDMKVIGYKSRARKNKWILQRLRDGAEFVCNDHVAKQFFKKREEITQ